MTNPSFGVCLVPEKDDELFLTAIIVKLAKKYKCYCFFPHITISGLINAPQSIVEEAVNLTLKNKKPFAVKVNKLSYGEMLKKTLFIDCINNPSLQNIFDDLKSKLIKYRDYSLDPHISLMYKLNLPVKEKEKIIKSIKMKKEILFNKCVIVSATRHLQEEKDVKDWKIVYEKTF